jgi:uncharacterized phage protein (TIGR01671 family)
MRELKFRAWDKGSKRMLTIVGMSGMGMSNGKEWIAGWKITGEYTTDRIWEQGNPDITAYEIDQYKLNVIDHELMQYTGLKDKNGKEIYEGDIVVLNRMWKECPLYGFEDGDKVEVEWAEGGFHPFSDNEDSMPYPNPCKCEVIGNIYENPELIKEP